MKTPFASGRDPRGFTLVELLVVVAIITLVSAATLPVILPAFNHRRVSEAARILQASLVGARDAAIRANAPRGIRLLPDPAFPGPITLASNRMISIEPAPDYTEGLVSIFARDLPTNTNHGQISVTEAVWNADPNTTPTAYPNNPTNWYWNLRQGDRIRFDDSGRYYTIAGPMQIGPINSNGTAGGANPERYINFGGPNVFGYGGATSPDPTVKTFFGGERIFLVNGQDDDGDGWVDESFDGIDNDGDGIIDPGYNGLDDNNNGVVDDPDELMMGAVGANGKPIEWEAEQFVGAQFTTTFTNKPYTIQRRPVVSDKATEIALPEGVVIDLTTWNAPMAKPNWSLPERSRLPVDPYTFYVDIMVLPSGQVLLPGGGTGSMGFAGTMGPEASAPFYHFWITEREDVFPPLFGTAFNASDAKGIRFQAVPVSNPNYANGQTFLLPMPNDGVNGYTPPANSTVAGHDAYLKGDRRLVTLFTRTGQVVTNELEFFNVNNTSYPYYSAQLGTREVK